MTNAQRQVVTLAAPRSKPELEGGAIALRVAGAELHIRLAGVWTALLPSGAAYLEAERTLICADLHLEKGSAYARRGQLLPPYDTRETLRRLAGDTARTGADRIVLLGDTLHDREADIRIADADAHALGGIAAGRDLIWIVGNHDPQGPRLLPGVAMDALMLGPLTLHHVPGPGPRSGEIAGHLHPCARVVASARSVRRRCFVTDGERLILPAYGAYAGGLNIRDTAFDGLFARPPLIGAIGSKRVHAVKFTSAGAE